MSDMFKESMIEISEWISLYRKDIERLPVLSKLKPGDVLKKLPSHPNRSGESFENIFEDFKNLILPGITHWQHPKFFGYFPSNSSPPSVLAEMLIAGLGVQGMSWATSPAATELEIRMMEWLRELFGFSTDFSGVIQDSASSSTMAAMIVAREKATDFSVNERGFLQHRLVAYCSEEAHSSVEKAAKIIGLGRENLRKIPVNQNQEMNLKILEETIQTDIAAKLRPFFIVGAFGTTGSTAVDSLAEIATLAKKYSLWFHVDAAYAGAALVLPEIRKYAQGINEADSIVINPHKWLFTTFDCSAFFIRDRKALLKSFSILPEYLKTPEGDAVTNFRDWGLGLGRRFRSLKLWFVLRWYGVEGIEKLIRSHIEHAEFLERSIRGDLRFEVLAERKFNLVCFRLKASDEINMSLLQSLNESGKMFLTHTKVNGRVALRMVIGQTDVQRNHVEEAWSDIQRAALRYAS